MKRVSSQFLRRCFPRRALFSGGSIVVMILGSAVGAQDPAVPTQKPAASSSALQETSPAKPEAAETGTPAERGSEKDSKGVRPEGAPAESPKPASADTPAQSEIPVSYPASRYAALLEKSLFALATAAPEPVAPVDNFASTWFLSSFSKTRSKDGAEVYTVFVKSRDLSTRLMLVGEKPDDGVTLVAVEEAPNRAETVAVLRKGTEIGRVKFDQAAFAAAPPPPPGPPRPGVPGTAPNSVSIQPGKVPSPSAIKTSIPRPGMSASSRSGTPVPTPAPPTGTSSSLDSRRRVRPIEAAPTPPQ